MRRKQQNGGLSARRFNSDGSNRGPGSAAHHLVLRRARDTGPQLSRNDRSFLDLDGCFSLRSAFASI